MKPEDWRHQTSAEQDSQTDEKSTEVQNDQKGGITLQQAHKDLKVFKEVYPHLESPQPYKSMVYMIDSEWIDKYVHYGAHLQKLLDVSYFWSFNPGLNVSIGTEIKSRRSSAH